MSAPEHSLILQQQPTKKTVNAQCMRKTKERTNWREKKFYRAVKTELKRKNKIFLCRIKCRTITESKECDYNNFYSRVWGKWRKIETGKWSGENGMREHWLQWKWKRNHKDTYKELLSYIHIYTQNPYKLEQTQSKYVWFTYTCYMFHERVL